MFELYMIIDRASKEPFSEIIRCRTVTSAVFGFMNWLNSQKDNVSPAAYSLWRIGKISGHEIVDTSQEIICGGEKAKALYDELLQKAIDEEMEDEVNG